MAEQSGMVHEVGALRREVEAVVVLRAVQSQQSESLQSVQSTVFKCASQQLPILTAHSGPFHQIQLHLELVLRTWTVNIIRRLSCNSCRLNLHPELLIEWIFSGSTGTNTSM